MSSPQMTRMLGFLEICLTVSAIVSLLWLGCRDSCSAGALRQLPDMTGTEFCFQHRWSARQVLQFLHESSNGTVTNDSYFLYCASLDSQLCTRVSASITVGSLKTRL